MVRTVYGKSGNHKTIILTRGRKTALFALRRHGGLVRAWRRGGACGGCSGRGRRAKASGERRGAHLLRRSIQQLSSSRSCWVAFFASISSIKPRKTAVPGRSRLARAGVRRTAPRHAFSLFHQPPLDPPKPCTRSQAKPCPPCRESSQKVFKSSCRKP